MSHRRMPALALALICGLLPAQAPLNRLFTCVQNAQTGQGEFVWVDLDTLAVVQTAPISSIYLSTTPPGGLTCMDKFGDSWVIGPTPGAYPPTLYRISGPTGGVLASFPIPPSTTTPAGRIVTAMATDTGANLYVATKDPNVEFVSPSLYITKISPTGQQLGHIDLKRQFPSGVFYMWPPGITNQAWSIQQLLVRSDGLIWVNLYYVSVGWVICLDANLNVLFTVEVPWSLYMYPDGDNGFCVSYAVGPPYPPAVPSFPLQYARGWVRVSQAGNLLADGQEDSGGIWGRAREDGTQFNAGDPTWSPPWNLRIHETSWSGGLWFPPSMYAPLPYNLQYAGDCYHMDGLGNLLLLRGELTGPPPASSNVVLTRVPHSPPYPWSAYQDGVVGQWFSVGVNGSNRGNLTLYEYAWYTDPTGDLDHDGIPNRAEIKNGTNPFVPSQASMVYAGGAAGTWLSTAWTIPGDAGLPYLAPFQIFPQPTTLPGGFTIPLQLGDPLVGATLDPATPWATGTLGFVNGQDQFTTGLFVPVSPSVSGLNIYQSAITGSNNPATLLRTIAGPFQITFP